MQRYHCAFWLLIFVTVSELAGGSETPGRSLGLGDTPGATGHAAEQRCQDQKATPRGRKTGSDREGGRTSWQQLQLFFLLLFKSAKGSSIPKKPLWAERLGAKERCHFHG